MRGTVFLTTFMLLVVTSLRASNNGQDTLRSFLEFIEESPATISRIMDSPEAVNPSSTIQQYLMFRIRLESDSKEKPLEWHYGWNDTAFVLKTAEYLKQRIVQDTVLSLIEPCLLERYVSAPRYDEQILLACAEYAIVNFHSRDALMIPQLYYVNHKEISDWQERLLFYEKIEFILLNSRYLYYFDEKTKTKLNSIIKDSGNESPYYAQYRKIINSYSDIELARISKQQTDEIVNTLLQGVASGEKMSQMTYSFMLLTGQFVEKDEKQGNELLSELLQ